jgi:transposase
MSDPPVRLFLGVDWATEEHQVCALSPQGEILGEKAFAHSGDGLAELVSWLDRLSGGALKEVWVGIETPHGAVVETLLERGCQVFSINPKQLDRFRDRHSPAGAKDDRRDAYVLADSLRTDPQCFRHLRVEGPLVLELREWSRIHDELKQERVRFINRLRDQLLRYFPQYLGLTEDVGEDWFLELWRLVPTPEAAAEASATRLAKVLKRHRIRRLTASQVLEKLRTKPISVTSGTVNASTAHIRLVADLLQVVNRQIRDCDHKIESILQQFGTPEEESENEPRREQRDVDILRSLPGVGRIVAATLLSEAAEPLRRRDYHTLRALAGVAPVTIRSGKSWRVLMRYACHPRLRIACYHLARVAMRDDEGCRAIYHGLRQRGKTHGRALRAVGDRLLRVACSMLRCGTSYDPQRMHPASTPT